jgi:DNA-binding NarL/FixJ family response regulator
MELLFALLPFAMAGGCAALTLALFISLKREISDRERKRDEAGRELAAAFNSLALRLHQLEQDATQPAASSLCFTSSMNVTKRTHALRRMRQGESPEQIASALNVPQKEIELLAKVNQIVSRD